MKHPMTYGPGTTKPVQYALKHVSDDVGETAARRLEMLSLVRELAEACEDENVELANRCEPPVRAVLLAFGVKNVVLMR